MSEKASVGRGTIIVVAALAIIALIISGSTLALVLLAPAKTTTPTVREFRIVITEFKMEAEEEAAEEEEMEAHVFYPAVISVSVGDTVKLKVMNLDHHSHGLGVLQFGVDTGKIEPGGTSEIRFVADRAGIFEYRCTVPYNLQAGDCAPDHSEIVGYIVVT